MTPDEPQAGGLGMTISEAARRYGVSPEAAKARAARIAALPEQLKALDDDFLRLVFDGPRITLTPHRGAFVVSFREEHGITQQQLATALRIDVAALQALEAGQKTTDAAGWAEIQTALFILASKPAEERDAEAGYIADPMSRPNIDDLLNAEDEPQTWTRDIGPLDT